MRRTSSCAILLLLLAACGSSARAKEARGALEAYFSALQQKDYPAADAVFAGSLADVAAVNPELDPQDHGALWAAACERNGWQCLEVRSAELKGQQDSTYVFAVEFSNADGSLFVLGPCCGSDATEMPPVQVFEYRVVRGDDGLYRVLDLPQYVP